ncbi:DUF211 domain-containing protein [Neptunomonas antarctica]|uniref:DUF211 domain-containing protein n=1 Tax=Neptunomonas antarctica TaxID=619304 RepID=A0A1N7L2Q0_9GAMM|nr:DUF211 domain-containing protein [Neptunomonas antarctica]SIS68138.1 hypothetical protein SAMN05421760_103183 [Neptunomonas antarctica]
MIAVKKVVLDVLKPHHPNALEFCLALSAAIENSTVKVNVIAVDEKTESLEVFVKAEIIDFDLIQGVINQMGGALHSIDAVVVRNEPDA